MKALGRVLPVALVAAGMVGIAPRARAQTRPAQSDLARVVDSLAREFITDTARGSPAVSVSVVRGMDTLVMNGWGRADIENDVPAAAQSVYRIGSITKQFTAAAVMQLVEAGKVRLDDAIGSYLPTLPASWHVATVRQLLNHTSGIPSYTDIGMRWVRRWGEEMPPDTLVALTAHDTLWFTPGTSWRYDNSGYVVLGMLIEKVAGRPWAQDLAERFTKPLGLSSTGNCPTIPIIPHRVHGYQVLGGVWANAQYLAMSQPYAAGAMCSTVGDLAKWDRALASGRVVSAASYARMTTPVGAAASHKYGFGLARDTLAGRTVITHNGGINGFSADNAWFPEAGLSVTVLTNSGSARSRDLLAQVARAAFGAPLIRPPQRVALSPAELEYYAGTYALMLPGGARDFTFFVKEGTLYSQLAGQNAIPVIPYGNDTFGAAFDPSVRIVFTMSGNRATRVTLHQGGGSFSGERR